MNTKKSPLSASVARRRRSNLRVLGRHRRRWPVGAGRTSLSRRGAHATQGNDAVEAGVGAGRRGERRARRFPIELRERLLTAGRVVASRTPWAFGRPGEVQSAVDLGLVEAWHRFDPARGCSFAVFARAWVRGVVARVAVERARAWRVLGPRPWVPDLESGGPSPETVAAARELGAALETLEPEERQLVLRHVVRGETLSELAADLGVSRTTAWRRYDLACARLRAHLRITLGR